MFIVVVGTKASASTWVYNVVRELIAEKFPSAVSLFAEKGYDVIANLPYGCRSIVIKAHSLDRAMVNLIELAAAKVIVTDRNPADSVTSQIERFGQPMPPTMLDLSKTYASLAMLSHLVDVLDLNYEDRFTSNPQTIDDIADFLELRIDQTKSAHIFATYHADHVRNELSRHYKVGEMTGNSAKAADVWDEATQWHPRHVGNGRIGKAKEMLSEGEITIIENGCVRVRPHHSWESRTVAWSARLFKYADQRVPKDVERLDTYGGDSCAVWGPYMFLPVGRWSAQLLVSPTTAAPVFFKADIYIPGAGRDVVTMKTCYAANGEGDDLCLDFTHLDHGDPIEVRLYCGGGRGDLLFRGVAFRYLGPARYSMPLPCRPIDTKLLRSPTEKKPLADDQAVAIEDEEAATESEKPVASIDETTPRSEEPVAESEDDAAGSEEQFRDNQEAVTVLDPVARDDMQGGDEASLPD